MFAQIWKSQIWYYIAIHHENAHDDVTYAQLKLRFPIMANAREHFNMNSTARDHFMYGSRHDLRDIRRSLVGLISGTQRLEQAGEVYV